MVSEFDYCDHSTIYACARALAHALPRTHTLSTLSLSTSISPSFYLSLSLSLTQYECFILVEHKIQN